MTKSKKTMTVFALSGVTVAAWVGGTTLLENARFAKAAEQVQETKSQLQNVEDLSTIFRNVGKAVEPSVVEIEVHKTVKGAKGGPGDDFFKRFFHGQGMPDSPEQPNDQGGDNGEQGGNDGSGDMQEVGTGSGVIMEVDGSTAYILTNNHVAGGATELTVTLNDGRVIKNAKVLGADPKSDLAVVRIKADHLIAANWGDSDQLSRGDWILAFGAPFGYVGSMTHGIVSALNRTSVGILPRYGYENFIQVDAPINPGNSGGPLVNIHGEVVGINTAIASRSGAFSGIGFAIPTDEARPIYNQLKNKGSVTRGWLGVGIQDVQRERGLARSLGYTDDNGVIVEQVMAGTPSTGKLKHGDVIVSVNGKNVDNVQNLRNEVAMIAPGETAKLGVFRDNSLTKVNITIGEQPADMAALSPGGSPMAPHSSATEEAQALGMHLSDVTDELSQKFSLGDSHDGALVTAVDPRSVAGKAGLQAGDLITEVGGETVKDAKDASNVLGKADLNKGVRLYISNHEGSRFIFLQNDSDSDK